MALPSKYLNPWYFDDGRGLNPESRPTHKPDTPFTGVANEYQTPIPIKTTVDYTTIGSRPIVTSNTANQHSGVDYATMISNIPLNDVSKTIKGQPTYPFKAKLPGWLLRDLLPSMNNEYAFSRDPVREPNIYEVMMQKEPLRNKEGPINRVQTPYRPSGGSSRKTNKRHAKKSRHQKMRSRRRQRSTRV